MHPMHPKCYKIFDDEQILNLLFSNRSSRARVCNQTHTGRTGR
jgi:hypothetical protein